jgi:hypothetical protein
MTLRTTMTATPAAAAGIARVRTRERFERLTGLGPTAARGFSQRTAQGEPGHRSGTGAPGQ